MIILVGASATGKTEVAKVLARKYGIVKVVTHTTRSMRVGEVNDVDYHFVSKEEFEKLLNEDFFIEHTLYNNNYYGTSRPEIADNKCVVVDVNGLKAFRKLDNKNILIFKLLAEEKTRYNRMLQRGDSLESAKTRIENDKEKFSDAAIGKVNYTINTDELGIEGVADLIYQIYKEKLTLQ